MGFDALFDALVGDLDAINARVCALRRQLLRALAVAAEAEVWRGTGARDMAHFVSMRYGISWWKADRWVKAALALDSLPRISEAFEKGELSIDKVVELTRFATPEAEPRLLRWAKGVSAAAIRRRADVACRPKVEDATEAERARCLDWWYLEGGLRLGLHGELPSAEGATLVRAIEREAARILVMPGEEDPSYASARRADALVSLCTTQSSGDDADHDRATVVVHAQAEGLGSDDRNAEIEEGGVVHPKTLRRLLCAARVHAVVEDADRNAFTLGRTSREPSGAMMRQLRYRDTECRFPGCGSRRFTQAHHIVWWTNGGRTDLENLVLLCHFHHKLVHEHGWRLARGPDGAIGWFDPDGVRYHGGPAPSRLERGQTAMSAVG